MCLCPCVCVSDCDPGGVLCVCGHVSMCQTVILVCPVCLCPCVCVSDSDPGGVLCVCVHVSVCQTVILVVSCVFVDMCLCVRL